MTKKIKNIAEEQKIKHALQKSEEKYRNLHDSMIDGYVFVDMLGNILESNQSFQQMVGYNANELASLTYHDLTPARWLDFEKKIVKEQILKEGHSAVYQKEYIRKDGTVFPIELRTFLIRNSTGKNEGMWAIVRDITERKQAEEALRESEEKFRSIVESSPTAMHIYRISGDDDLILIGANPSADRIIGISHKFLLGKTIEEAFPNLAGTEIPEMYKKVAKGELGHQTFDTEYADERFSGFYFVHIFQTEPGSIAVDFIDITARRQMEEELLRSKMEYRDTLDSLPDWIYVVNEEYRFVMVNAMLREEHIRNGLLSDCMGTTISTDFPFITNNTMDEIRQVFVTGKISVNEHLFTLSDRSVCCEITRIPFIKDKKVEKVIVHIRDRSKEKEIEELKRRNTEQKEVLLREIHHRVKNNLAIVISLLNFQLRNTSNKEFSNMIIDIQMRIRSMALIHEHLYRSENLDRIPVASYIESLANTIMTTFSGHNIKLVHNLDPVDVSIGTALPIGLIINELLTNAVKYAFPDGKAGEIKVRLEKEDDQMCTLLVEDNGIGLPASTSMDSEKSLGLYIVRLLVEQLDGTVNIQRDKGTSFHIRFRNLISRKQEQLKTA